MAISGGCTGGQESSAAETNAPKKESTVLLSSPPPLAIDASKELRDLNQGIPLYGGAHYSDQLSQHDAVLIHQQYGASARVYTLTTDDSFPQVWHYYTTYLAQFRAYPVQPPYPPEGQTARTMEVQLNQAMQDPFIPSDTFKAGDRQVTLVIAENEEARTLIRYIVTAEPIQTPPALQ